MELRRSLESCEDWSEAKRRQMKPGTYGRMLLASSEALRTAFDRKKVVFLDVDGVLNRTEAAQQIHLQGDLVWRLSDLVTRAGNVDIVLSTYWRVFHEYLGYLLGRFGVPAQVVGRTQGDPTDKKNYKRVPRAAEIRDYCRDHGVQCYVILDDRLDAALTPHQLSRFVRTIPTVGLTEDLVNTAVDILLNQDEEVEDYDLLPN